MKNLLIYYNFIVATTFVLLALLRARDLPELITGALFSPLLIYFILLVLPRKNPPARIKKEATAQEGIDSELSSIKMPKLDMDRRLFLKLIASGGVSFFLFSLFTRKAEKTSVGSILDSGTVPAKDATDGYQITEIDDSTPTYYGYINTSGSWFIRKESENSSFRYCKGPSNFTSNWASRASLDYDYFNNIFSTKT